MRSLSVVLSLILLCAAGTLAQDGKASTNKATAKASKSRGSADAQDPNIKSTHEKNNAQSSLPAPPQKGGSASRGVCAVHFDNRTQWYIQVFVDGDGQGTVGPYGDGYAYAISGATTLYGRAVFDDGSVTNWGPQVISCHGTFSWSLTN
jgi:hypothetical protein